MEMGKLSSCWSKFCSILYQPVADGRVSDNAAICRCTGDLKRHTVSKDHRDFLWKIWRIKFMQSVFFLCQSIASAKCCCVVQFVYTFNFPTLCLCFGNCDFGKVQSWELRTSSWSVATIIARQVILGYKWVHEECQQHFQVESRKGV